MERVFASNPSLCAGISFVMRTGNTFLGSLLWVDFVSLFGMQKAKDPEPVKGGKGKKGKNNNKGEMKGGEEVQVPGGDWW